jgi:NAD(P)-dependent dehydrogenase (short-subunit alcohol dehydrogenase family)
MGPLVWVVTGCSSGFGERFINSILARGDKAIATGRKLEQLKHLEDAGAAILQLDITDSQQSIRDIVAKAIGIYGRIDVLVNNASYVTSGIWEDLEYAFLNNFPEVSQAYSHYGRYEDFLAQFNTNVFGTIKLTRALLPHFRQRQTGTMIFIGSLSGWIGHPGVSAYAGSKFALEGKVILALLLHSPNFRINNGFAE